MILDSNIVKKINNASESLDLIRHGLWDEDIDEVVELINKNHKILFVKLSDNNISDKSIAKLKELIKVHSLELSRNNITNAGAIALVGHAKFSRLDLSWNLAIGDETGRCVAQFATQIYLDLTGCTISETILAQANSRIEANMAKFQAEIKLQSEKKPHRSGAHEFFPPIGKSTVVEEFKEHSSVQKLT